MLKFVPTLASAFLFCVGTLLATPLTFVTTLTGPNEFPANASPGFGVATVNYDPAVHSLRVQVNFLNLLAGVTASHIHCCVSPSAVTPTAGVATTTPTFTGFPSGVTSGTYDHLFDMTLASSYNPAFVTAAGSIATAEANLANGFANGTTYLNIHTTAFPGGEIRGFLVAAPEPGTFALIGLGLAAAALVRRRSGAN